MLPWWHLALSLIISYILVASLGLNISTGIKWIIVGCIFGTLIDLDHLLYASLVYGKEGLKYIKGITHPKELIKEFQEKGVLYFHAWRRIILHTITMFSIYALSLYLFPSYSLIIGLVLIAHLICDVEPRWLKLKEIWKMHKKSIVSSLLVILAVLSLIYVSAIQGRFIWIYPQIGITGYFVLPEFSILAIFLSFLVLLLLFILFSVRTRKTKQFS